LTATETRISLYLEHRRHDSMVTVFSTMAPIKRYAIAKVKLHHASLRQLLLRIDSSDDG
jgi:hypothetical protein